jgi:hypothetical protein
VATPRTRETQWHDPGVPWPPIVGDRLPRAAEAYGITEKLVTYSLNIDHRSGGPKAKGFQQILGITLADVDHLAHALTMGVLTATITEVRVSPSAAFTCGVLMPVAGLRQRRTRVISVKTGWHLRHADDRPRLVTAYING